MHFGDWLKTKRVALGISLDELAVRSGRSKNYLSVIERNAPHHKTGTPPTPSSAVLDAIARGLALPAHEVRGAWARLGNGGTPSSVPPLPPSGLAFEDLQALFSSLEEADQEEMVAYAQFRALRRAPGPLATAKGPTSSEGTLCVGCTGEMYLRLDRESGALYTHDGQRVTSREDLLEIAALLIAQVTRMELDERSGDEMPEQALP